MKLILLSLISAFSISSFAMAPFSTTGTANFARFRLGTFEVTSLSDGTVDLPMSKLLKGITPADYQKATTANFLTDPVETSDNAYLVNTGTKLILVDTAAPVTSLDQRWVKFRQASRRQAINRNKSTSF